MPYELYYKENYATSMPVLGHHYTNGSDNGII